MTLVRRVDRSVVRYHRVTDKAPPPGSIEAKLDADGFLRIDGRVSRGDCVLEYSDGKTTWGELRMVEDVYDDASLASMSPKPIVDASHTWVTPENYTEVSQGTATKPRVIDGWCVQELFIQSAETLKAVENGDAIELSCGYECTLIKEEGTYDGVPYKYRQKDVRLNHVAIGPVDWARTGNDACLIFDTKAGQLAQDSRKRISHAVQVLDSGNIMPKKKKLQKKSSDRKAVKPLKKGDKLQALAAKAKVKDGEFELDGETFEVDDKVIAFIEGMMAEIMTLKASNEGEEIESEAESEEVLEETEGDVENEDEDEEAEEKTDRKGGRLQATIDAFERYKKGEASRIDARARLIADARDVLGKHAQLDGVPAIEIQKQVIDRLLGSEAPKLDGRSADYVQATYEMAMVTNSDSNSLGRKIGFATVNADRKTKTLDSAYRNMLAGMSGRKETK